MTMTATEEKSFIDGAVSGVRHSQELPWVPFPGIEGSWFKLLRLNRENDGGVFLLRVSPGVKGPRHKHFGSVEYYQLSGTVTFGDVTISPGSYVYELGGFEHSEDPPEKEDMITLFIVHGPLQAWDDDGNLMPVTGLTAMAKIQERYIAGLNAKT